MNQNNAPNPNESHAIVIGGSVAGLLTARVLTDFFKTVTVIERDILPDMPTFRKGAPQARHAHGLMGKGQRIMEEFFPGFTDGLIKNGALKINMGSESAFYMNGKRAASFESAISPLSCSRALIEYGLYSGLQRDPSVRFRQQCAVESIDTDAERTRVSGVTLRSRRQPNAELEHLQADVVVDASGRGSPLPKWLAQLGFTPPNEISVDAKAGYASRIYRRTEFGADWKMMYYLAEAPTQSRGGIIVPIEGTEEDGDRWIVTLVGLNGDHPPTDEQGFLDFARSLPTPEFAAAFANAEPLSEPYGYQRASNRLRQYDKLPRYLEGLFAIGDAVYALNPVYGQGMTVAALGAKTLHEVLQAHQKRDSMNDLSGVAKIFQRKLASVIDGPWQLATGQDMRWPVVAAEHKPSFVERLVQNYFNAVLQTMANDAVVAEAFFHVQNMLKPPTALFHPAIMWRVWQGQRQTVQREPAQRDPAQRDPAQRDPIAMSNTAAAGQPT